MSLIVNKRNLGELVECWIYDVTKIIKLHTGHSTLPCYKNLFRVITFYRSSLLEDWGWKVKILAPAVCVCMRVRV